jgi:hypothetical protein
MGKANIDSPSPKSSGQDDPRTEIGVYRQDKVQAKAEFRRQIAEVRGSAVLHSALSLLHSDFDCGPATWYLGDSFSASGVASPASAFIINDR